MSVLDLSFLKSNIQKNQLNLIIGFDTANYCLKIMRIVGNDHSTCKVDYISVAPRYITRGEWAEILADYLPDYIKEQNFDKTFAVHLVMPDKLIGSDIFTVPTLSKAKSDVALETQMSELYTFYRNYKFKKILLSSNRTNSAYEVIMLNKDLLNSIYKALSANKLYVKNATYNANAALNSVFALRPKTRKTSFLFLDISSESARITVCANGTTVGWVEIPFGLNVLARDKVVLEANVVFNDIANVAVINATEIAKRKKMTTIDDGDAIREAAITVKEINADEIPAEADENASAAETAENKTETAESGAETAENNADANLSDRNAAELKTEEEAAKTAPDEQTATVDDPDDSDDNDEYYAEEERGGDSLTESVSPQTEETVDDFELSLQERVTKAKVKTYARKIKKLPAFMMRPTPETPEGFIVENFRLFVKRALLVKMQNEQSGYIAVPQYVLVNMPEEYAFVIDEINKEEDNGIPFRYFDPAKENNVQLTSNLDLYGALFMSSFNKTHNF